MPEWFRLTGEQAHKLYGIPEEVAFGKDNAFYSGALRPDNEPLDGPYSWFAFVGNPDLTTCTLHIKTCFPEELEKMDELNANPLSTLGWGVYLYMKERAILELCDLLVDYSIRLISRPTLPKNMFQPIQNTDLSFPLDPAVSQFGTQLFYQQRFDPLHKGQNIDYVTYLELSFTNDPAKRSGIHFSILQFDRKEFIENVDDYRTVTYKSIARVNLNKAGLLELSDILKLAAGLLRDG